MVCLRVRRSLCDGTLFIILCFTLSATYFVMMIPMESELFVHFVSNVNITVCRCVLSNIIFLLPKLKISRLLSVFLSFHSTYMSIRNIQFIRFDPFSNTYLPLDTRKKNGSRIYSLLIISSTKSHLLFSL